MRATQICVDRRWRDSPAVFMLQGITIQQDGSVTSHNLGGITDVEEFSSRAPRRCITSSTLLTSWLSESEVRLTEPRRRSAARSPHQVDFLLSDCGGDRRIERKLVPDARHWRCSRSVNRGGTRTGARDDRAKRTWRAASQHPQRASV